MPYLSQNPEATGEQVFFNDHVFSFSDPKAAREAARRLADCNSKNSLWELVDLVARFEADVHLPKKGKGIRPNRG